MLSPRMCGSPRVRAIGRSHLGTFASSRCSAGDDRRARRPDQPPDGGAQEVGQRVPPLLDEHPGGARVPRDPRALPGGHPRGAMLARTRRQTRACSTHAGRSNTSMAGDVGHTASVARHRRVRRCAVPAVPAVRVADARIPRSTRSGRWRGCGTLLRGVDARLDGPLHDAVQATGDHALRRRGSGGSQANGRPRPTGSDHPSGFGRAGCRGRGEASHKAGGRARDLQVRLARAREAQP